VRRTESERAIDLAYKAVARRDLTVAELRVRLERKHVPPEAIDDAVAELEETGFVDDARYARQFAEDKREIDQWGTDRIATDLRRRGIAPQLIDAALVTHDRDSEMRTALLLLRHGYSPDLSYDAIRSWERTERERRRAA
jgi:regulatory protein